MLVTASPCLPPPRVGEGPGDGGHLGAGGGGFLTEMGACPRRTPEEYLK